MVLGLSYEEKKAAGAVMPSIHLNALQLANLKAGNCGTGAAYFQGHLEACEDGRCQNLYETVEAAPKRPVPDWLREDSRKIPWWF